MVQEPCKPLTLDFRTEWLAQRVGLEYWHINPLMIDCGHLVEFYNFARSVKKIE